MLALALASVTAQASPLWGGLTPGDYNVGFRVEQFDAKRSLEVMLWYPSDTRENDAPPLAFGDYAKLVYQLKEQNDADALQEWLAVSVTGSAEGLSVIEAEAILSAPMHALPNANMVDGEFPLIVWTMRYETMAAQSVLSEFLASYGYVVAFVRYQNKPIPAPWTIDGADAKKQALSESVEDLNDSIVHLGKNPRIDATNVAVMNWSYAAEASPQLQMQNDNVKFVAGLSSNPLSSAGVFLGAEAGAALQADKIDVPYAILSERIGTNGKERVPPEILNELTVPSHYIAFEELAHGNFNVLEGMIPGVFDVKEVQPWSLGGPQAKFGYESICRHVLHYVTTYLSTDDDGKSTKLSDDPRTRVTTYRFGPIT